MFEKLFANSLVVYLINDESVMLLILSCPKIVSIKLSLKKSFVVKIFFKDMYNFFAILFVSFIIDACSSILSSLFNFFGFNKSSLIFVKFDNLLYPFIYFC